MSGLVQEILEDYDHDQNEIFDSAFGEDIDRLNEDEANLICLEKEVTQLLDCTTAVESFGMNPTAYEVMKTTGLLSGTSLMALGAECFNVGNNGDLETQMALESLTDKIKDSIAKWSAKILAFATSMSEKTTSILSSLWIKITDKSKALTDKAWDTASVAGKQIKAHPFKTIAAVVAAAAAVAAIVALIASGMPGSYANESALKSFTYKVQDMISKIQWPFGKFAVKVAEDGSKIVCHMDGTKALVKYTGTVAEAGWTQTAVKAVMSQLNKVWSTLKTGIKAGGMKVFNSVKKIDSIGGDMGSVVGGRVTNKTGSKIVGWATNKAIEKAYITFLWSMLGVMYVLIRTVVIAAFRMVAELMYTLTPKVKTT